VKLAFGVAREAEGLEEFRFLAADLLRRKLANADFLRKASAEVVQKERDRLAENEAQIETVEATLTALG